jgi:hypothetical protein
MTDLIFSIDDAEEGNPTHENILSTYSDKDIATKFQQHTPVDLVGLLRQHPTIENIYLTRGIGQTFWRRHWRPVMQYANANNKYETRLLTPSGYAFYQQGRYNRKNPANRIDVLSDFILTAWQEVWHEII